jgi:hypothetical protein
MNLLESFLFLDFFYKACGYEVPATAVTQAAIIPAFMNPPKISDFDIQKLELEIYFNKKLPFNIQVKEDGSLNINKFVRSFSTEIAHKYLFGNSIKRASNKSIDAEVSDLHKLFNAKFSDEEKKYFPLIIGDKQRFSDLFPENVKSLFSYAHYLYFDEKANLNTIVEVLRNISSNEMNGSKDYISAAKELLEQYFIPQSEIDSFSKKMVSIFNYQEPTLVSKYSRNVYFSVDSEMLYSQLINYQTSNGKFGDLLYTMADNLKFKIIEPRELLDFIHSLDSDNKLGMITTSYGNDSPRGISYELLGKRFKQHLDKFNSVNVYLAN